MLNIYISALRLFHPISAQLFCLCIYALLFLSPTSAGVFYLHTSALLFLLPTSDGVFSPHTSAQMFCLPTSAQMFLLHISLECTLLTQNPMLGDKDNAIDVDKDGKTDTMDNLHSTTNILGINSQVFAIEQSCS